jgi:acetyl esterase/lipase
MALHADAPLPQPLPMLTTRRTAVRLGAGGFATALSARGLGPAVAQEVTPSVGAGWPSDDSPAGVETVSYGTASGQELLLDVYRPAIRAVPGPAIILIHGGFWSYGSRADMAEAARHLRDAGYVAFSVEHRLLHVGADNTWPAQLDDVQRAVRWVRAHAVAYGVDPERIASYGSSSGAHLAAMLGVRDTRDNRVPGLAGYSSRVDCVVALSGDMDLTWSEDSDFIAFLAGFLGATAEELPEARQDASPLTWVDRKTAPFFMAHGGFDDVVLTEQSRRMMTALYDAGVAFVYDVMPETDHEGTAGWSRTGPLVLAFLQMHLHPEQ